MSPYPQFPGLRFCSCVMRMNITEGTLYSDALFFISADIADFLLEANYIPKNGLLPIGLVVSIESILKLCNHLILLHLVIIPCILRDSEGAISFWENNNQGWLPKMLFRALSLCNHMMCVDDTHQCNGYLYIWNNVIATIPQNWLILCGCFFNFCLWNEIGCFNSSVITSNHDANSAILHGWPIYITYTEVLIPLKLHALVYIIDCWSTC